jgi:hypothetical protein
VTEPAPDQPVLYAEQGSSWWPLLWGPLFAGVGAGVEALSGPVHGVAWLIVGLALFAVFVVWVNARRRVYAVALTPSTLQQGREHLPVARIAKVADVGASAGARVLGGGWTAPRRTTDIPLRLDDGSVVVAWARDDEELTGALRRLVDPEEDVPVE